MFIAEVGKLSMVGKSEVWIIVDSGKLSRESDGREICSRKKDVAPSEEAAQIDWCDAGLQFFCWLLVNFSQDFPGGDLLVLAYFFSQAAPSTTPPLENLILLSHGLCLSLLLCSSW